MFRPVPYRQQPNNQKIDYAHIDVELLRTPHTYTQHPQLYYARIDRELKDQNFSEKLGLNPWYNHDVLDLYNNSKIAYFHDGYEPDDLRRSKKFSILCPYCRPFDKETSRSIGKHEPLKHFYSVENNEYFNHMNEHHGVYLDGNAYPQPFIGETITNAHKFQSYNPSWTIVCPHTLQDDDSKPCLASFIYNINSKDPLKEYFAHFLRCHVFCEEESVLMRRYRTLINIPVDFKAVQTHFNAFLPADFCLHVKAQQYLSFVCSDKLRCQPFLLLDCLDGTLDQAQAKVVNFPTFAIAQIEHRRNILGISGYLQCCYYVPPPPSHYMKGPLKLRARDLAERQLLSDLMFGLFPEANYNGYAFKYVPKFREPTTQEGCQNQEPWSDIHDSLDAFVQSLRAKSRVQSVPEAVNHVAAESTSDTKTKTPTQNRSKPAKRTSDNNQRGTSSRELAVETVNIDSDVTPRNQDFEEEKEDEDYIDDYEMSGFMLNNHRKGKKGLRNNGLSKFLS